MRLTKTSIINQIKLSDKGIVPKDLQILKVGSFNHPLYGQFEITSQILSDMKSNFENKVRGIDTSFDYFHDSDKEASAWVTALELREDNTELWALVEWTPKAEQKLSDRELRYFSPDFAFQWTDPEKNITYNNVLFGGGLTNRPFLKEMQPIVANEIQGETMTELEKAQAKVKELETANLKLSEDMKAKDQQIAAAAPAADKVSQLEQQIAALQAELQKAKGDAQVAMAEKQKMEEAKQYAEKESAFNVLLSEGKACAAQKDAYMKNDMAGFIKLAQPVQLKASGSSTESVELKEGDVTAIIKLAEEKCKANPKLAYAEAISMAKKELKK